MIEPRLRFLDRVADARARRYGYELDALIRTAKACGLHAVPVEALEALVDRMLDGKRSEAAAGQLVPLTGDGTHQGG